VWGDVAVALAVARAGTLSGAARELAVERTTVGRRLAAFEEALGVRLFDRTPEGYVPTHAGETALDYARDIEERMFALERNLRGRDVRIAGTVRVTGLDPFINDVLLPNLDELVHAHPELVVIAATDMRVLSLSRREADIAIRYSPPKHPDHVGRRLGNFTSALYASKAYLARHGAPRHPKKLRGHDLVGLAPEYAEAPEEQWLARHGQGARIAVRASCPTTQLTAIRLGLGIGVYPCHAADREPDLVRVSKQAVLRETLWAVVHVDMARSARVRAVLDLLSERVAAERARLEPRALEPTPRSRGAKARRKR
jgi:DNA-binding transcriptional LysR family regulator